MHTPLERGYAIHFSPRNSDQSQFNLRSGYSRTHKIHCSHLARSEKVSTSRIGIWGLRNGLFPIAHGQKRDLVEVAFGKLRDIRTCRRAHRLSCNTAESVNVEFDVAGG